jgi:2,4-dienoyl-CoA reductase-like NADH-dependent reductase (Old Yellow Enzyme family)
MPPHIAPPPVRNHPGASGGEGDFMPTILDPLTLGAIAMPNRVVMAPLTRGRGTRAHVPTPIMADYYAQRASAGLIISEATGISQEGLGWPYAPGLWNPAQVEAWKPVIDRVHEAGGRIVAQLWHMGRLVHPSFLGGGRPVAASPLRAPGHAHTYEGKDGYAVPRPLGVDEVERLLGDYARAASNALTAGFDGVQIHAANGYLIDTFLRDGANERDDAYGGSPENRARLLVEVTQRVVDVVGASRTGVRLSPNGEVQGTDDSDPHAIFPYAAAQLSKLGIAFLELREPQGQSSFRPATASLVAPAIRKVFGGALMLNSDFTGETAERAVESGAADAIAFGRPFIANPDLVRRIADGLPLNEPDYATFYTRGAEGYTDYPAAA